MKLLYSVAILVLSCLACTQPVLAQTYPANPKTNTLPDTVTKDSQQKNKKKKNSNEAKRKTRVVMKREVSRTSMAKRSDNSPGKVEVVIRQSGATLNNPLDLQMIGSTGTVVTLSNYMAFENMELPFEGVIRFKSPNLMNTVIYEREVRFVVAEPGQWVLRIEL